MAPVASVELLIVTVGGEARAVTAALGQPYLAATGEWRCPVRLTGLYADLADMAGEDSLQALCMAASLLRALLQDVIDRGGRVLLASDCSEYALEAVFGRVGEKPG